MSETISIEVKGANGKKVSTKEVPANVFASEVSQSLVHQVVRWQRASKRAGTHKVKTRTEVSGGGAKPWRQKGTGRARAGSSRSPVWVGGGVAHGPKVRKYDFRLNKQERRKALCSALSARQAEGALTVVDSFNLSEIKTKVAAEVLANLGVQSGSKVLLVLPKDDEITAKSVRNIQGVNVNTPEGLNVYDVINAKNIIILDAALESIGSRLSN